MSLFPDTPRGTHKITRDEEIENVCPIKPYPRIRETRKEKIDYMVKHDLIEHSKIPWSFSYVLLYNLRRVPIGFAEIIEG